MDTDGIPSDWIVDLVAAPPDVVPWPPERLGVYCGFHEGRLIVRIIHDLQIGSMATNFWWDFYKEGDDVVLRHSHTRDAPHVTMLDMLAAYHAHQWAANNIDMLHDPARPEQGEP